MAPEELEAMLDRAAKKGAAEALRSQDYMTKMQQMIYVICVVCLMHGE